VNAVRSPTPDARRVTQCPTFDAADITSVILDTNACSTCSTQSCNLCVDSNTLFFACTNPGGSSACAQGPYTLPPSSIEPNVVLDIQCPVFPSPTTFSGLLIATFVTTTPVTENIIVFYIAYGVAAAIGQQYSVTLVEIVSIQLGSRSTSSQVSFKLSAVGSLSASQVAGALATAVNNGTSPLPIVGGITGPGVPTPSPAPTSSSGGSGISLSKGALAGIIIGCILGALLLALIIAYLLLRRQNNYMHPFRAPAAAYRP